MLKKIHQHVNSYWTEVYPARYTRWLALFWFYATCVNLSHSRDSVNENTFTTSPDFIILLLLLSLKNEFFKKIAVMFYLFVRLVNFT